MFVHPSRAELCTAPNKMTTDRHLTSYAPRSPSQPVIRLSSGASEDPLQDGGREGGHPQRRMTSWPDRHLTARQGSFLAWWYMMYVSSNSPLVPVDATHGITSLILRQIRGLSFWGVGAVVAPEGFRRNPLHERLTSNNVRHAPTRTEAPYLGRIPY